MLLRIRETATYLQRAERLNYVREQYRNFRKSVEKDLNLHDEDGRIVFLKNVSQLTRSTIVFLHLFHLCGSDPQLGQQIFGLPTSENLGRNLKDTSKFIRLSWCTQFQFQLETLFKILLQALGKSVPRSYWQITQQIVDIFQIPNPQDVHDLLNVIAFIRNSQHANGIHHGYQNTDTLVIIDGVSFEFKHGQLVKCVNWDHIAHAWMNHLPIVKHIYLHPKVCALPSPLPDQFWP